ncbi:glycosyltransferase [Vibrio breoganii]|uniref:glycosyltransferase n=1 Tax=Vibrio breoganii TaxID=553239 RepID=UPI00031EC677|nr:glycosyltransferase [Vibrio breoganii]OED97091.1 glycosyl transferase [Vibrio breoganii ZF-29]PMF98814.1 glycosyl transferase [Vibrio breoganii]
MRDLIVFGEDFGGLPSSTQHIITRLNPQRRILWVNSIGLRRPRLSASDMKRAYNKLFSKNTDKASMAAKVQSIPSNMEVISLKTLPAPKFAWERKLAKSWMASQLAPTLERLEFNNPILWTSLPTAADLCGHINESSVVYYCGDDFGALAGVDHKTVIQHENKLTDKANLILTASEAMQRRFPACKTQLLRHGVDYERFSTPVPRAKDLPNGKPIAGFYGSLSNWLDYDLINQTAKAMPDWNFVFIGRNELGHNPFADLDNIHLLGPRAHHELPSYSQHWDVSLLPFILNEQIKACSPLKLMEYVACGTPVITTRFPALKPFEDQVNVVNDSKQLIDCLSRHQRLTPCQSHSVENESWQQRSQFVDWLLELL